MFRKEHPEAGATPGTLAISADSPPPIMRMIHYARGMTAQELEVTNTDDLHQALSSDSVTWVDVQGFGDQSIIQSIGEVFKLNPLLLEDVVNVPHRPKAEEHEDQLLVIIRMFVIEGTQSIYEEQVSIVLGHNYVITFQERYGDVLDPVRRRIRSGNGPIRHHGADFLAYAIADTIVDAYYPILEQIGDQLEQLEDLVVTHPTPQILQQLNRLKNRLVNLRRAVWPQREALNQLVRGDHDQITPEVRLYLRDTYEHCVQTSEVVEMYREMATGLMNTYLTAVANQTNEVMKVLTIVGTIFIPLTFVAGVYGMNFDYMPELHSRWGYPVAWILMACSAISMLVFFGKKGWIGRGRDTRQNEPQE